MVDDTARHKNRTRDRFACRDLRNWGKVALRESSHRGYKTHAKSNDRIDLHAR